MSCTYVMCVSLATFIFSLCTVYGCMPWPLLAHHWPLYHFASFFCTPPVSPGPGNTTSYQQYFDIFRANVTFALDYMVVVPSTLKTVYYTTQPKEKEISFSTFLQKTLKAFVGILCILRHMFEACQTGGERHSCQHLVGNSEFYKHCGRFLCCLCFTVRNVWATIKRRSVQWAVGRIKLFWYASIS